MRLTDDIMRASDKATAELVGHALALSAAGRYGLLPASLRPFEINVNPMNGYVSVETLSCLAITKDGHLIDANYDTHYTDRYDTRVEIPAGEHCKEFILTINADDDDWREVESGFEEPEYTFHLYAPNTVIPDNALPIAHIIDDYGWRMDETSFMPPCLFVSSHWKYGQLAERFADVMANIDAKTREIIAEGAGGPIRIFWPLVQQLRITVSKEVDVMTPNMLLASVQKCVSAFTSACALEPSLELENIDGLWEYIQAPYNYKDAYERIQEGLNICFSIVDMVQHLNTGPEKVQHHQTASAAQTVVAPYIGDDQLFQNCRSKSLSITVTNPTPGAKVLYSTDESEPKRKLPPSGKIVLENGFSKKKVPELDQQVTIHLKAVLADGTSSEVSVFTVTLHKDYKEWQGWTI